MDLNTDVWRQKPCRSPCILSGINLYQAARHDMVPPMQYASPGQGTCPIFSESSSANLLDIVFYIHRSTECKYPPSNPSSPLRISLGETRDRLFNSPIPFPPDSPNIPIAHRFLDDDDVSSPVAFRHITQQTTSWGCPSVTRHNITYSCDRIHRQPG
ncbi:hypothetical protein E2P81_ATG08192 [Venturia nashicola]|nr:hypothetical protein E2P81_ATG08192 [Venturia nashicola]